MFILRHLTKQFGTRLALRSFNVHRLGSSINYVCERLHQELDFSVLDTKNGLCSKYIWSRSYTSQVSTNFKVVSERLKDRNVPQVEAALESADFKKHIRDLVSYYYDFEIQTGQKAVKTSMSIVDLYQIHVMRIYYGFIQQVSHGFIRQVGEHLSKSDSFKKLLETLPDHVENISIGDQLDIYMGLLLLGVEETNSSMNNLFCHFHKTDSMLGLSELAKIRLVLLSFPNQYRFTISSIYTPKIHYLLKNNCIKNQEDCKSIALFIQGERYIDEKFFKMCNQMFFYTAHSNVNDIDFILKILNAFFSSSIRFLGHPKRMNRWQTILPVLKKIMDRLEPQIEILTSSKVVAFLIDIRKESLAFFHMNYSRIFKDMCARVVFSLEGVLTGDLPLEEKVDYLYITAKLYSINPHIITSENINKMLHFITESTPGAKLSTIFTFVQILLAFKKNRQIKYVLNCLITETLEILQSQPTFHFQIDGINIVSCLDLLSNVMPWYFNKLFYDFVPYITWFIESGHACSSYNFFQICKIAIPILGNNMSSVAEERIRNQILLMHDNEDTMDEFYWRCIHYILQGALLEYSCTQSDYADSIIRLLTTTMQRHRINTKSVIYLIQKIPIGPIQSASIFVLMKTIADQVVVDQNHLAYYTSTKMLNYISEKNANTLLRYSAMAYFNGKSVGANWSQVLLYLISMFFNMSRYPKDKQLLENFSRSIIEKYFDNLPIYQNYKILHILCRLGIYLDQYLQIVFSQEYLAKMDEYVVVQNDSWTRNIYGMFKTLNRDVVLHRQELNIPWISDPIGYQSTHDTFLQETVEFDQVKRHLNEVLGKSAFLETRVTAEYGINIDFKFYLDSSNKPMGHSPTNQMLQSKSDIQKIAVIIGRKTSMEYLAEDSTAPSVYNTNEMKCLNALGYKAVLIQGHEWDSLMPEGRNHFLKEKIFEKEME